jgi:DnaJ-class molecular chaperone
MTHDDYAGPTCPDCGSTNTDTEECWQCHGEGGWHDCGEDVCCCLDKEEITERCPECNGTGRTIICHACTERARRLMR